MSYELILVMVLGLLDISVNLWRRIFEDRVYSEIERQSLQSLKLYLGVFFFLFLRATSLVQYLYVSSVAYSSRPYFQSL